MYCHSHQSDANAAEACPKCWIAGWLMRRRRNHRRETENSFSIVEAFDIESFTQRRVDSLIGSMQVPSPSARMKSKSYNSFKSCRKTPISIGLDAEILTVLLQCAAAAHMYPFLSTLESSVPCQVRVHSWCEITEWRADWQLWCPAFKIPFQLENGSAASCDGSRAVVSFLVYEALT